MGTYEQFITSLLPGNYALTKSMELTKRQDSGTLWYTKKFLTLYYYIFLSNDIMTKQYQLDIIRIFDSFINSLDKKVQTDAINFFYPQDPSINLKSEHFNFFSNFASFNSFENQKERLEYYQRAKKYYFSLLMGSGGQTGVKHRLKESVRQPGFIYSTQNIDHAILNAAVESCIYDVNNDRQIHDNSIKYILSAETMARACKIAQKRKVLPSDILELNSKYPHHKPGYRSIENDMVAFIRNERQILYYYGFFHSKSSGATDFEFSSLTPIGELALTANFYEFLSIWEHQKIKMISQPATADINNITLTSHDPRLFGVSFTPYTDILGYLIRNGRLTLEEYKFIVSRKKNTISEEDWIQNEESICAHIDAIKDIVQGFARKRDIEDEDGRKELLKYILGLRDDLPVDKGTNPLQSVSFSDSSLTISNAATLEHLYAMYIKMEKYKQLKYHEVLKSAEQDLRKRYVAGCHSQNIPINEMIKIHWDLYNIHADKFILLGVMLAMSSIKLRVSLGDNLQKDQKERLVSYLFGTFNELLKHIGLHSLSSVKTAIQRVIAAINSEDYSFYLISDDKRSKQVLAEYQAVGASDLYTKIQQISNTALDRFAEDRKRNTQLIGMMKSYYMLVYSKNNMLPCECCGQETFMTDAKEPYIEFHHLIPFNIAYGPDHYLNLFALCPNCHRKMHFLNMEERKGQYKALERNNYAHLKLTQRLQELREHNLLRSYHLEYLFAENAITEDEYNMIAG